jgi:hypothetical protein
MRFMGWDYPALLACPADYIPVINERARRESSKDR